MEATIEASLVDRLESARRGMLALAHDVAEAIRADARPSRVVARRVLEVLEAMEAKNVAAGLSSEDENDLVSWGYRGR